MNETEFLEVLSNLTGIDLSDTKITTELNNDGQIVRIIVFIDNEDDANTLVDAVNSIDKDEESQKYLKDMKSAKVKPKTLSVSKSYCFDVIGLYSLLAMMFVIIHIELK